MEKKNKIVACSISIAIVLMMIAGVWSVNVNTGTLSSAGDTAKFKDYVKVEVNGKLWGIYPNTVTNTGKNWTRDVLSELNNPAAGVANSLNISRLSLSNDSSAPAAGDTACDATILTGDGLASSQGVVAENFGMIANYTVAKIWTATGISEAIQKVCLMNTTGTTPFATALISPVVNLASGDSLTVTYFVSIS